MFNGERGFFALVVIALVFATIAWAAIRPVYPNLPRSEFKQADETEYSPGSPRCYPSRIESLPKREATDERYRCETQAEKHRLQSDDLVQQAKAANAAEAIVGLTYSQTLMGLAGTIFGLLTLLAAAYAAWYARRAAEAGHVSNALARDGQRAWIVLRVKPKCVTMTHSGGLNFQIDFVAENIGETVATHFNFERAILFTSDAEGTLDLVARVQSQVETWRSAYSTDARCKLLPKEIETEQFRGDVNPPELLWWNSPLGGIICQPICLVAVFYRTVDLPQEVQLSWRSWHLSAIDARGNPSLCISKGTNALGSDKLHLEQFATTTVHQEYRAT